MEDSITPTNNILKGVTTLPLLYFVFPLIADKNTEHTNITKEITKHVVHITSNNSNFTEIQNCKRTLTKSI